MLLFLISKDPGGCTGIYLYIGSVRSRLSGEIIQSDYAGSDTAMGLASVAVGRFGYTLCICFDSRTNLVLSLPFLHRYQTDNSEVLEEWTPLFVYLVLVAGVTEWVMHLCLLQLVRYLEIVSQATAAGSDLDVKKGVPAGSFHSAKYIMTFNPSISLIYEKGRKDTCDT